MSKIYIEKHERQSLLIDFALEICVIILCMIAAFAAAKYNPKILPGVIVCCAVLAAYIRLFVSTVILNTRKTD